MIRGAPAPCEFIRARHAACALAAAGFGARQANSTRRAAARRLRLHRSARRRPRPRAVVRGALGSRRRARVLRRVSALALMRRRVGRRLGVLAAVVVQRVDRCIAAWRLRDPHVEFEARAHAEPAARAVALVADEDGGIGRRGGEKSELIHRVQQQRAPRAHLRVPIVHASARAVGGNRRAREALGACAERNDARGGVGARYNDAREDGPLPPLRLPLRAKPRVLRQDQTLRRVHRGKLRLGEKKSRNVPSERSRLMPVSRCHPG